MPENHVFKIRLSLKGRPIKTYTFDKEVITVGRDPSSDIVLDNVSVSRDHLKFELSPTGYYSVEDLGSGNGTFLNDEAVKRDYVYNNDVVRVGKYSLWISFEEDRRTKTESKRTTPDAYQGTMILSGSDMNRMMNAARDSEAAKPPTMMHEDRPGSLPSRASRFSAAAIATAVAVAFLLGTAVGAGATFLFAR